jgi:hypothetical protein
MLSSAGVPSWTTGGSHTITHNTNIIDYSSDQIGTFCETTGDLADVYGTDYIPTLERSCDAIVKIKQSNTLNPKIIGIITDQNNFMSHGDVLCRVIDDIYNIGDLLVPDTTGLFGKGTQDEITICAVNQIHLPKVTARVPGNNEIVACFMS